MPALPRQLDSASTRGPLRPGWTRRHACAVIALGCLGGCASWQSETSPPEADRRAGLGLSEPRVPDDGALVEALVVPMATIRERAAGFDALPWERMDTTVLDPAARRRLAANGLRAGRVSTLDLEQLTNDGEVDESLRLLQEADVLSDFEHERHTFTCRPGQSHALAVRRQYPGELATLIHSDHQGVTGKTLERPQFTFRMRTVRLDDGRLMVRLVPEIQHGQARPNYVAKETLAFRLDYARPSWTVEELAIEVPLSAGQAAVIAPTEPPFGLGRQMLVGRRADQALQQVAVVVQLKRLPSR